jgi:hypothetical protein
MAAQLVASQEGLGSVSKCGGTLGTAATTGLVYHPRMIGDGDCVEKLVE